MGAWWGSNPANPVGLTGRAPVLSCETEEGWGCGLGACSGLAARRSSSFGVGGGGSATGPRMSAGGAVGSQDLSPEAAAWVTPENGLSQPFSGQGVGFRWPGVCLALSSQQLRDRISAFGVLVLGRGDCPKMRGGAHNDRK
jgi:hypothetical protein